MKFKVFGCKTNIYFAEKWANHPHLQGKEGIFVASCVVTDQAKAKWVKFVKKAATELKEGEKIYLSGCGSMRNGEIDPDFYTTYHELGNLQNVIELLEEDPSEKNIATQKEDLTTKIQKLKSLGISEKLYTRKHLVIQTGCDNFCTFCLTVQARGRHKSRDITSILEEINEYITAGGKEVVLTGTNIWAWWAESSNDFSNGKLAELIDVILEKTSIERLRISSLGVEFLNDTLLKQFAQKRVHAYVHLSIQSGSDKILKAMNRHYNRKALLERLEKLHTLEREDGVMIQIWADLIVGFPWETDTDFLNTLELVEKHGVSQLHAFPFSAHVDKYHVPAGKFSDQIPEKIKLARLKKLMEAGEESKKEFLKKNSGSHFSLLLEWQPSKTNFSGWSENYIALDETNFLPNETSSFVRGEIITGKFLGKVGWKENKNSYNSSSNF